MLNPVFYSQKQTTLLSGLLKIKLTDKLKEIKELTQKVKSHLLTYMNLFLLMDTKENILKNVSNVFKWFKTKLDHSDLIWTEKKNNILPFVLMYKGIL